MPLAKIKINKEVTDFISVLHHPMQEVIDALRPVVLGADERLTENIKWNGPNYHVAGDDRITMRIMQPSIQQLIRDWIAATC
jgi:hypothetical protein